MVLHSASWAPIMFHHVLKMTPSGKLQYVRFSIQLDVKPVEEVLHQLNLFNESSCTILSTVETDFQVNRSLVLVV